MISIGASASRAILANQRHLWKNRRQIIYRFRAFEIDISADPARKGIRDFPASC